MLIRQIGPGALEYRHIPARQTEKLQNLRIAALHPVFGTGGAAVMERSGIECFQTEALLCLQGIGYGKLIVDFIIGPPDGQGEPADEAFGFQRAYVNPPDYEDVAMNRVFAGIIIEHMRSEDKRKARCFLSEKCGKRWTFFLNCGILSVPETEVHSDCPRGNALIINLPEKERM